MSCPAPQQSSVGEVEELLAIRNMLARIYSGLQRELREIANHKATEDQFAEFLGCPKDAVQRYEASIADGDSALFAVQRLLDHPPQGWSLELKNFHRYNDGEIVPAPFVEVEIGNNERRYCVSQGHIFADTPQGRWIMEIGDKSIISNERTLTFSVGTSSKLGVQEVMATFHEIRVRESRFKRQRICMGGTGVRFLEDLGVQWSDVYLEPHVEEELKLNVFSPMLEPEVWRSAGLPLRRSLLLSGAPGTGKSQIGRLIASQIPETFIAVTADGVDNSSDIQRVYRIARENRPTVLFFEDLDVVVSRSGVGSKVFGELLSQMDGFESNDEIITLATTNHPEVLDEALKDRPGRFDRHIVVDLPPVSLREGLFRHFIREAGMQCEEETIQGLVERSKGMSGAHIREIVATAAIDSTIAGRGKGNGDGQWALDHFLSAARKLEKVRPQVGFRTS